MIPFRVHHHHMFGQHTHSWITGDRNRRKGRPIQRSDRKIAVRGCRWWQGRRRRRHILFTYCGHTVSRFMQRLRRRRRTLLTGLLMGWIEHVRVVAATTEHRVRLTNRGPRSSGHHDAREKKKRKTDDVKKTHRFRYTRTRTTDARKPTTKTDLFSMVRQPAGKRQLPKTTGGKGRRRVEE